MALPSLYDDDTVQTVLNRISKLTPETKPSWGKMNVSQMLAHCCVTYEYIFDERNDQHNFLKKWVLKTFIKKIVVGEKLYEKNGRTAPAFIITDKREFEKEKTRLINYINRVKEKGESFFENKASSSFGVLNKTEWNNMMYKHLDHHLNQFGV